MSFLNMLCYHFSLEVALQGMAKNNPTVKQFEAKIIQRHKACAMKTGRRENVKIIVTNYKDRFTSQITATYPNITTYPFSFVRLLFVRFLLLR